MNKTITDDSYDKSLAVKCVNGTFVGKLADSTMVFRGIPYVGQQPVGELRWKAPVDVVPCDSVYEAYYNAKSACQPEVEVSSYYYQDENCLYLNVWKSAKATEEQRPVIVWIHGGAYAYGGTVDPLYDFHNFVEENPDVIVVSAAYRLGVLGFLHLSHLLDGIGRFSLRVESIGVDNPEDFNIRQHITRIVCGFLPAGRRIQGRHIFYDVCDGVKAVWQKGFKP